MTRHATLRITLQQIGKILQKFYVFLTPIFMDDQIFLADRPYDIASAWGACLKEVVIFKCCLSCISSNKDTLLNQKKQGHNKEASRRRLYFLASWLSEITTPLRRTSTHTLNIIALGRSLQSQKDIVDWSVTDWLLGFACRKTSPLSHLQVVELRYSYWNSSSLCRATYRQTKKAQHLNMAAAVRERERERLKEPVKTEGRV